MLSKGALGFPHWPEGPSEPYTHLRLMRLAHPVPIAYKLLRFTRLRCIWLSPFMCGFTHRSISTRHRRHELSSPSHPLKDPYAFRKVWGTYRERASTFSNPVPCAENIAPGVFYCPMSEDKWYYKYPECHTPSSSTPSLDLSACKQDKTLSHLQLLELKQSQAENEAANGKHDSSKTRVINEVQPLGSRVDRFYVSPVCEAMGCLWQWRAVWCARTPKDKLPCIHARKSAIRDNENSSCIGINVTDSPQEKEMEKVPNKSIHSKDKCESGKPWHPRGPGWDSGGYHMLPFLIFPSFGGLSSGPPLHLSPSVVSYLFSKTPGWGSPTESRQEHVPDKVSAKGPVYITIPSLIGNVIIKLEDHAPPCAGKQTQLRPHRHTPPLWNATKTGKVFTQVFSPQRQRAVENIFDLLTPAKFWRGQSDAPPRHKVSCDSVCSLETLPTDDNSATASSQTLSPQYSSDHDIKKAATTPFALDDTMELLKTMEGDDKPTSSTSEAQLPLVYRNIINGGLAELILAVDCYAALIARKELTVASACWAILCDTKHSHTLPSLRRHALDIEREILAAVESQEHLARVANRWNRSSVGKSSCAATKLMKYPDIAHWCRC